jgi:carbon-monoxide dehydrogenase medium subunit
MTIPEIAYHRPATVAEACELSRTLGPAAAFLAGGTELLPDFLRGREPARHLIALHQIAELRGITLQKDGLHIGALTTLAEIASSAQVQSFLFALCEAARAVGSAQVRSVATIGGNVCRAVSCADMPPMLIAAEGAVRVVGPGGGRSVPLEHFLLGARKTVLQPGEMLVEVVLPMQPRGSGAEYERFARRRGSSLAVASVAARVTLDRGRIIGARVALGAVAPAPLLVTAAAAVLEEERPSEAVFEQAAQACAAAALPISDLRGSAAFRHDLVAVLTRRALAGACTRAAEAAA